MVLPGVLHDVNPFEAVARSCQVALIIILRVHHDLHAVFRLPWHPCAHQVVGLRAYQQLGAQSAQRIVLCYICNVPAGRKSIGVYKIGLHFMYTTRYLPVPCTLEFGRTSTDVSETCGKLNTCLQQLNS